MSICLAFVVHKLRHSTTRVIKLPMGMPATPPRALSKVSSWADEVFKNTAQHSTIGVLSPLGRQMACGKLDPKTCNRGLGCRVGVAVMMAVGVWRGVDGSGCTILGRARH